MGKLLKLLAPLLIPIPALASSEIKEVEFPDSTPLYKIMGVPSPDASYTSVFCEYVFVTFEKYAGVADKHFEDGGSTAILKPSCRAGIGDYNELGKPASDVAPKLRFRVRQVNWYALNIESSDPAWALTLHSRRDTRLHSRAAAVDCEHLPKDFTVGDLKRIFAPGSALKITRATIPSQIHSAEDDYLLRKCGDQAALGYQPDGSAEVSRAKAVWREDTYPRSEPAQ